EQSPDVRAGVRLRRRRRRHRGVRGGRAPVRGPRHLGAAGRGRPVGRRRPGDPQPLALDGAARVRLRLGLPRRAAGARQLLHAPCAGEGARRVLVAQLGDRVLGTAGEPRRLGGPGLHRLGRRRELRLLPQARDRARRGGQRRAPRTRHGRTGDDPVDRAEGPLRAGAAGGPRAGRAADHPVQHRSHGAARRQLVPGQRQPRRHAQLGVGGLPAPGHGEPPQPRGLDRLPRRAPDLRRLRSASARHRRRPAHAGHALDDRGHRPPRDDRVGRGHRRAEAADALGHRAGRAPALGGHRGPRRRAGRGGEPPGPPRGPRAVGGPAADADRVGAVVGNRHLCRCRGPDDAGPDVPLRVGAVRPQPRPVRLPEHREHVLPHAERHRCAVDGHRAPADPRLPRQAGRRPALLHPRARPRGDDPRGAGGPGDRGRAGAGRLGGQGAGTRRRGADRRRDLRLHREDPQHRLPPVVHGEDGSGLRPHGPGGPAAARPRRRRAARRRRVDHAGPHHGQPVHHHDDDRRTRRGLHQEPAL
ncbi:MAG: Choline oxidase, partial [uncultured Actinomycetospora sp.]